MTRQAFVLSSNAPVYADFIVTLKAYTDAAAGFSTTQVIRDAAHDSSIKVVFANVTEEQIDADSDLEDARVANYPNELVRHRFPSLAAFRQCGFHMLNESVRSTEGVAGRKMRYIRPPMLPNTANYGAGTGFTHYDAFNGPQDTQIGVDDDGGASGNRHRTGRTYMWCGGAHCSFQEFATGANSNHGQIGVEDPTGLGEAGMIHLRCDDPMFPGMPVGHGTIRYKNNGNTIAWEEYDSTNHIYVHGSFNNSASFGVSQTATHAEADIEDVTVSEPTLRMRHVLKGHADIADLNGTGGRCRYYAQASNPSRADWDAVLIDDGAGNFTNVTTAASNSTEDDFTVIPSGAADNYAVYFVSTTPFSAIWFNDKSSSRVGGTFALEYGRSGDYAAPTVYDPVNFLSGGTNFDIYTIFNPKIDWVQTTVAEGTEHEITGWAVRIRKTGGTVTQSAIVTQCREHARAVFVHRWNDTTPVNGLIGELGGLRYVMSDKGNFRFTHFRTWWANSFGDTIGTNQDVDFRSCQIMPYGSLATGGGTRTWRWGVAPEDDGAIWWDRSDILVYGDHAVFDDILSKPGADQTKFLDNERWSDICGASSSLYQSNSGTWSLTIDGLRLRRNCIKLDALNDSEVIDLTAGDSHSLGLHGGYDNMTVERLGIEEHNDSIDLYVLMGTSNDKPVSPAASQDNKNMLFQYGYHYRWSGYNAGAGLGHICFKWHGSNGAGPCEDGSGVDVNNLVQYWHMFDDTPGSGSTGTFCTREVGPEFRYCTFDGMNTNWSILHNFWESCHVVRYDSVLDAWDDITDSVKHSGNTVESLFVNGTAGDAIYFGIATRKIRKLQYSATQAGIGSPELAVEIPKSGGYTAVSGLSDTTNGFAQSGEFNFNRDDDQIVTDEGGNLPFEGYWWRVRIVSGSYSTIPTSQTIYGRRSGASINIHDCVFRNIPSGGFIGRTIGAWWSVDASYVIDHDNTIHYSEGQDDSTDFYKFTVVAGGPTLNRVEYQASSKSRITTDAEVASQFGVDNTYVPAA